MITEHQKEEILARFSPGFSPSLDIGPGWEHLVYQLHTVLKCIDPNYQLHQCKEKFGGLRYYISTNIADLSKYNQINNIIHTVENKSIHTCEECGKPGSLRGKHNGWYYTSCENHIK